MNIIDKLKERILIIDGAMGTMIQRHKPTEEIYRGERFKDFHADLKGNNELLSITQPEMIQEIHEQFIEAGADIIETNTFSANSVSQADYDLQDLVDEMNSASVKCAKNAAARFPEKDIFIAGALGPTNRTASLSPDVNNPAYRAITFNDLKECYYQQAKVLIESGVDLILIETVFDTLNCKAAIFALLMLEKELGKRTPIMISGTITDASGRTLSGQTTEAFWYSINHANPLSVGLNCALGAEDMRPYIEVLSKNAWVHTSLYPNAGLPNEFGEYDDTPEHMAKVLADFATSGFLNIVGGCCGTTPEHIKAIAQAVKDIKPRELPQLVMDDH